MNVEKVTKDLITWIRYWFKENGHGCNAVVGISGGKDSSVVAALCVEALGANKVIGVLMPNGKQKDIKDSIRLCEYLDIPYFTINIEKSVDTILDQMESPTEQTCINLPARIRMATLYAVSQSCNGRVANTCNLSEDTVGYATRYGDGAGDFSPLSKLTVTEVLQIGDYLRLPYDLVHKTPIDGLKVNEDGSYITDEQSLGFTYADIDDYIRNNGEHISEELAAKIRTMEEKNAFKLRLMDSFEPNRSDL